VDEELLRSDRLSIIRRGPTYEVDDATNKWRGAIERLGTNYDLLECPGFPVGAKAGSEAPVSEWIRELRAAGHLSQSEEARILAWNESLSSSASFTRSAVAGRLARAFELIVWEEWDALHAHVAKESAL
jgi:hypothetical protein